MTVRVVSEDCPVSRDGRALLYQMSVAVREVEVGGDLRVVVAPKVVPQLVSEAEVAECAGLGDDLQRVPAGVGGHVGHATIPAEVCTQQCCRVCRISYEEFDQEEMEKISRPQCCERIVWKIKDLYMI